MEIISCCHRPSRRAQRFASHCCFCCVSCSYVSRDSAFRNWQSVYLSIRNYSTEQNGESLKWRISSRHTKRLFCVFLAAAAEKKSSVLDVLPGDSIAAKAGYLTVGTGLATALIAKEIYILNEETLVLVASAGLLGVLLKYLREPYTNMAQEHIEVR